MLFRKNLFINKVKILRYKGYYKKYLHNHKFSKGNSIHIDKIISLICLLDVLVDYNKNLNISSDNYHCKNKKKNLNSKYGLDWFELNNDCTWRNFFYLDLFKFNFLNFIKLNFDGRLSVLFTHYINGCNDKNLSIVGGILKFFIKNKVNRIWFFNNWYISYIFNVCLNLKNWRVSLNKIIIKSLLKFNLIIDYNFKLKILLDNNIFKYQFYNIINFWQFSNMIYNIFSQILIRGFSFYSILFNSNYLKLRKFKSLMGVHFTKGILLCDFKFRSVFWRWVSKTLSSGFFKYNNDKFYQNNLNLFFNKLLVLYQLRITRLIKLFINRLGIFPKFFFVHCGRQPFLAKIFKKISFLTDSYYFYGRVWPVGLFTANYWAMSKDDRSIIQSKYYQNSKNNTPIYNLWNFTIPKPAGLKRHRNLHLFNMFPDICITSNDNLNEAFIREVLLMKIPLIILLDNFSKRFIPKNLNKLFSEIHMVYWFPIQLNNVNNDWVNDCSVIQFYFFFKYLLSIRKLFNFSIWDQSSRFSYASPHNLNTLFADLWSFTLKDSLVNMMIHKRKRKGLGFNWVGWWILSMPYSWNLFNLKVNTFSNKVKF